jgi:hypothetical protein
LDDAAVILNKWSSENVQVRCQGSFATHAFAMEGMIEAASDDEVRMTAVNKLTQVVVKLTDDLKFNYADSREVTGDEAGNYPSCVAIAYEPMSEEGTVDTIAFAEISATRGY